MAYDSLKHAIGAENFSNAAGSDLSGLQYHAVQTTGAGIVPAVVATSGGICVLYNNPTSGGAVTAYGPPHVVKAKSGGTFTLGQYITITGSSAFHAGSEGNAVGVAYTAATSGDIFALRLR